MNTTERANHHYYTTAAPRTYVPTVDVGNQINTAMQNMSMAVNDHASRLDSLFMELNDMRSFYMWITDTYPEHLEQYRSLLDLARAGK